MSSRSIIKLLIGLVILLATFFIYKYFFVSSAPDTNTPGLQAVSGLDAGAGGPVVDDEFIRLLDRLKGVELNSDLFSTPAWGSLTNFRIELEPEEKKRQNPFAPIGFDRPATSTPASGGASTTPRR